MTRASPTGSPGVDVKLTESVLPAAAFFNVSATGGIAYDGLLLGLDLSLSQGGIDYTSATIYTAGVTVGFGELC